MKPTTPDIRGSLAWLERAERLIPSATQTLAKGPSQHVRGLSPVFARSGHGARLTDVDDNTYLDYGMGIGPLVLGYGHPEVDAAIRAQLDDGITFTLMHPLEVLVAERLAVLVPGAESVRFSKTGCDVTSAAIRLARAFTGRERVLCCGYHGWHDWHIGVTDRSAGIPEAVRELTSTFRYNDLEGLAEALSDDTAAVILEPITVEAPREGFLLELRRLCDARGTLLIFDEMWTGFRCALGGAQERFAVRADLACFSKAIANGMPLAALTGRRDVMALLDERVFFYTTFGGEALSLAAACATLEVLARDQVPAQLERLGTRLQAGYNRLAARLGLDWTRCVGLPCRTLVTFAPENTDPLLARSFVQQELVRRGILWSGFHNLSLAHTEHDIDTTLVAYAEVLPLLAEAVAAGALRAKLLGAPVAPVFRRSTGFDTRPRAVVR